MPQLILAEPNMRGVLDSLRIATFWAQRSVSQAIPLILTGSWLNAQSNSVRMRVSPKLPRRQ